MHYGRKLPVQLATPAHHINFQGPGVKVETSEGTINSKAAILTVSTGILGVEKIKFTPTLPVKKQESFQYIPMGTYNNATLQFSKDFFGLGPDRYVADRLFFAGEATHPEQWATCGGGLLSGIDAAKDAAHALVLEKEL